MSALIGLGVFLLLAAFGLSVIRFVERGETREKEETLRCEGGKGSPIRRHFLEQLAYGFLGGVAVTGLAGQATIWLGFHLTTLWWSVLAGGALALVMATVILDFGRLREGWRSFRSNPSESLPHSPIAWSLMVLTLAGLAWSFRQAIGLPLTGWDPLSFWYLKTRILFHEGTVFGPDFLAPDRMHAHTDYPILVNIVESGICRAFGEYREAPLKVLLAVWETACVVVAGMSMARRRGSAIGWTTAALLVLLPALTDFDTTGAVSGYRDAPLALVVLAAACVVLECTDAHRLQRGDAVRIVLLLVLLIGTKREGTAWALLLGLVAAGAIVRSGKGRKTPATLMRKVKSEPRAERSATIPGGKPWRRVAVAVFVCLVLPQALMLPWFLVRAQLPYPRSEDFVKTMEEQRWNVTGERATVVLAEFRDELFLRVQKWGVLWWIFGAVALWRRRGWTQRERLLALLVPAGWLMAALGFVFTPWGDPKMHLAVSIDRLVLQGGLLALWLTVLNLTLTPTVDGENLVMETRNKEESFG